MKKSKKSKEPFAGLKGVKRYKYFITDPDSRGISKVYHRGSGEIEFAGSIEAVKAWLDLRSF